MYPFGKPPLDSQLKQQTALSVSPKHSENVDRLRRRNGYFPQVVVLLHPHEDS
jgi:hypothetical protein